MGATKETEIKMSAQLGPQQLQWNPLPLRSPECTTSVPPAEGTAKESRAVILDVSLTQC